MSNSKYLASLIGPTMVAVAGAEALNYEIFDSQSAPIVFLNGALLFVAGLAIVRAHNRWGWRWEALITATGWIALCAGLYRLAAPAAPQAPPGGVTNAMLAVLAAVGVYLSYKGYAPTRR